MQEYATPHTRQQELCLSRYEYRNAIRCGAFTDDDGYGYPVRIDEIGRMHFEPGLTTSPSLAHKLPEWATHVVWFNR